MDCGRDMLLLCLTIAFLSSFRGTENSKFIAGYWIEFIKWLQLQNAVSNWKHIFIFPLSELHFRVEQHVDIAKICLISKPFEIDITGCKQYHESLDAIISHTNVTVNEISQHRSIITLMIDQCTTHRVKLGLFDGIGIGLKKLVGVTTEGDIQKL